MRDDPKCENCGVSIFQVPDGTWFDRGGGPGCYDLLPTLRREREKQGKSVTHHPAHDYVKVQDHAEPVFGQQMGPATLRTHPHSQCEGRDIPCCIHAPSDHHMIQWDMNWRADTGVMERFCPHGIGHPDPDHMAYVLSVRGDDAAWQGSHSCDGCCAAKEEK